MRLTARQLHNYRNLINQLAHNQCVLNENGIFEINNVQEVDAKRIENDLRRENFIADVKAIPGRYNFNKFDFSRGMAEPEKYFTVRGILKENSLEEAVEIHTELNPKIWSAERELLPEVRAKILQIVDKFKSQLSVDGVDLKVEDIYVLGSNANYNYNEDSDLDVHIIADESFDCSKEHLALIYNCYKALFNSKYDIRIKGINVELYVENKDKLSNVSAGVYSLNNGWVRNPAEYKIPEFDQLAVDRGVQLWEDRYYAVKENPSIKKIDDYINSIYELRQSSIQEEGEFGEGNLVFKEIRRLGYLDDLKQLKVQLTSKELSLESLNEGRFSDLTSKLEFKEQELDNLKVNLENAPTEEAKEHIEAVIDSCENEISNIQSEIQEIKKNTAGTHLLDYDESLNEDVEYDQIEEDWKDKIRFRYCGPVYHFEHLLATDWEAYTEAVSEAQALNNLTVKAKKEFGYTLDSRITLDSDCLEVSPKEKEEPFIPDARCEKCGRRLNDNGECPECDLGDESVLEEEHDLGPKYTKEAIRARNIVRKIVKQDVINRLPLSPDEYVDFEEECALEGIEATKELFDFYGDCLADLAMGRDLRDEK